MDAPKWSERNNPALVPNLRRVLERWRNLRWPVFMVADDDRNPDSPYHPGQPGNDFKAELAPIEGEQIIRKTTGSAFIGTDFESRLRSPGYHTLVVGGFQTNKCVEAAVLAARDRGFTVFVLADGTATVGKADRSGWWNANDVHQRALADMQSDTTHVIDIEELLTRVPAAG
jgi:nicotinamidase-related amidase